MEAALKRKKAEISILAHLSLFCSVHPKIVPLYGTFVELRDHNRATISAPTPWFNMGG